MDPVNAVKVGSQPGNSLSRAHIASTCLEGTRRALNISKAGLASKAWPRFNADAQCLGSQPGVSDLHSAGQVGTVVGIILRPEPAPKGHEAGAALHITGWFNHRGKRQHLPLRLFQQGSMDASLHVLLCFGNRGVGVVLELRYCQQDRRVPHGYGFQAHMGWWVDQGSFSLCTAFFPYI